MGSLVTGSMRVAEELSLISNVLVIASFVSSMVLSNCGEVILNLLRGVSIVGGIDGSGDDGDDDDMHLLQDGAAVYSVKAALITGGSTYGARTVFLSVNMKRDPLGQIRNERYDGTRPGLTIEVVDPPQKDPPLGVLLWVSILMVLLKRLCFGV
nr:hypothetical protein [Tanacetum cinerariifolium]